MTLFSDDELIAPAAPSGPLVRVRMLVAYDGSTFHGFAVQRNVRTVGGAILEALEKVVRHPVELTCAGRTDKGVHAWGQVVHVDLESDRTEDLEGIQRSLNKLLAPAVVIREIGAAPDGFDARFSATARHYRYTILNSAVPDPFLAKTAWQVEAPLDLRSMQAAADPLIGEHDFAAFCRRPPGNEGPLVRRVSDARWHDLGEGRLRFDISANAFCHQMVRSVVGTLVDVGLGKLKAGDIAWILRTADRQQAGQLAPPRGLVLWHVDYGA